MGIFNFTNILANIQYVPENDTLYQERRTFSEPCAEFSRKYISRDHRVPTIKYFNGSNNNESKLLTILLLTLKKIWLIFDVTFRKFLF